MPVKYTLKMQAIVLWTQKCALIEDLKKVEVLKQLSDTALESKKKLSQIGAELGRCAVLCMAFHVTNRSAYETGSSVFWSPEIAYHATH